MVSHGSEAAQERHLDQRAPEEIHPESRAGHHRGRAAAQRTPH